MGTRTRAQIPIKTASRSWTSSRRSPRSGPERRAPPAVASFGSGTTVRSPPMSPCSARGPLMPAPWAPRRPPVRRRWPSAACTKPDGSTRALTTPRVMGYLSGGGDPPTWTAFTVGTIPTGGTSDYSNDLWVADVDGDGFADIIHASKTANAITWYKNPCTATPCTPTTGWTAFTVDAAATGVTSLAFADLDLDGRLDIVANSSTATAGVVWYQNNGGNPVTWTKRTLTTTAGATGVVVANLNSNGDRAPDIIASGTSGAGTIDRWLNSLDHSNIRFQVRTWSQGDNTCSAPTGSFLGPDGSAGTYYTATSETLRVANNQCLQYRASFFTTIAGMNPNIESVTVSYDRSYF